MPMMRKSFQVGIMIRVIQTKNHFPFRSLIIIGIHVSFGDFPFLLADVLPKMQPRTVFENNIAADETNFIIAAIKSDIRQFNNG